MKKLRNNIREIDQMMKVVYDLPNAQRPTLLEFKVLIHWACSREGWASSHSAFAEYLGADRSNVSKAFSNLIMKRVLVVDRTVPSRSGRRMKIYKLDPTVVDMMKAIVKTPEYDDRPFEEILEELNKTDNLGGENNDTY